MQPKLPPQSIQNLAQPSGSLCSFSRRSKRLNGDKRSRQFGAAFVLPANESISNKESSLLVSLLLETERPSKLNLLLAKRIHLSGPHYLLRRRRRRRDKTARIANTIRLAEKRWCIYLRDTTGKEAANERAWHDKTGRAG